MFSERTLSILLVLLTVTMGLTACRPQTIAPMMPSSTDTPTLIEPTQTPTSTPTPLCSRILYGMPEKILTQTRTADVYIFRAADFNDDGLEDVILAKSNFGSPDVYDVEILLNDGSGGLRSAASELFTGEIPQTQHPRHAVLEDFNGDGRTDVFIADHGQDARPYPGFQNTLILSAPGGKLTDASAGLPQQKDFSHSAAAADIDNDGDLDIFIGNVRGQNNIPPQIWLNDGSGAFTIAEGRIPPAQLDMGPNVYTWSAFADVDGDGSPDLILGADNQTANSVVLLNDGQGTFSLLPNAMPPKPLSPQNIVVYIEPADIDGDAYSDLILSYSLGWYIGRYFQILINNGDGTFRDETGTRLPQENNTFQWAWRTELHDLDNDGDLDITTVVPFVDWSGQPYYLNDGNGYYSAPDVTFRFTAPGGYNYTFLDMFGDGGLDALSVDFNESFFLTRDLGCRGLVSPGAPTAPEITPTSTISAQLVNEGLTIYDDALADGWSVDTWQADVDLNATAFVHQGERAIQIAPQQPWGGINLFHSPPVDLSEYAWLVFYANGGAGEQKQVNVAAYLDGSVTGPYLSGFSYLEGGWIEPGQWQAVVIPLADLNPGGGGIDQISISDGVGKTASIYIDDIRLVANAPLEQTAAFAPAAGPNMPDLSSAILILNLFLMGRLGAGTAGPGRRSRSRVAPEIRRGKNRSA